MLPDAQAWEGWGTALKPSFEPIVVARKALMESSVAANCLKHGTGALNIDAARIPYADAVDAAAAAAAAAAQRTCQDEPGRVRWGDTSAKNTGFQDPEGSLARWNEKAALGRWPANVVHDGSAASVAGFPVDGAGYSAARYFFSGKADKDDRFGSQHATVKPIDLIAWLVRMVTCKGGTVLDPFAGSGTTGMAALREGCNAILIEMEAQSVADIHTRLAWARGEAKHSVGVKARNSTKTVDELPLFGVPKAAAE